MNRTAFRIASVLLAAGMLFSLTGCWNYSEIDDMSIVAGVALDKNKADNNIQMTVEMIDTQGGLQDNQTGFKMLSLTGDTIFSIARSMISLTGRKLFWSHAKAIIISEELAREGLVKVIDWYSRDTETRADVFIFVAGEKNAREVLNLNQKNKTIMSFELAQMMKDEMFTGTAPVVEIWDFIDKLETPGKHAIAPLINISEMNGQKNGRVSGTAVFVEDRMVGKLDGTETQYALFVKNNVKGGVLTIDNERGRPTYSLEILSNRTKVKPVWENGKLQIEVHTLTHTGLDEVMSTVDLTGNESLAAIENRAGAQVQRNILSVIRKLQRDYQADIFGFGKAVHDTMPRSWHKLEERWPEAFKELDVKVTSKVIIQSTAKSSRTIKVGD
ncbi:MULTISPECIES: Ger(x)C family spore germination protein [unclassified Paenibacillus]|uniref:Ger(x)C family spore germination protein n=1 Tax=unclassified Paenibacillus TaxID=185978 RepID=UPI0024054F7E|nr:MULTISPECIES: Ger(x)C family spore germination protein [unclassified Paenibacillus]MDF9843354.1 spore germination protein KC [Paenibacillus sp. PastF-2]MDF9849942.1 spore germination protein KC [Paenibacillus sp. PastM-2]MDF9856650.1 spore germination protein KC [Paenibacillus sp. PastF-1]MDH6481919.1 spore germination protein KC [Paenibacillus sp. PastH-2]MDH6509345.1 spore germination protein KC [Paenibacillus sp. PastM-3]